MECHLVTVLIVTWNRKNDVLETIRSVYDQKLIPTLRSSWSTTVRPMAQWKHSARPVPRSVSSRSTRNTGAASGRNVGIAVAQGDIIFCLDSDASSGNETWRTSVERFQADPKVGIINSKIVNAYTREIDHTAGWAYAEGDKADQDRRIPQLQFF